MNIALPVGLAIVALLALGVTLLVLDERDSRAREQAREERQGVNEDTDDYIKWLENEWS